jgi:hypothetical protein
MSQQPAVLPAVSQIVRLRVPGSEDDLPTRVEQADPAELLVAAPVGQLDATVVAGELGSFLRGDREEAVPVEVVWGSTRGECRMRTLLVGVERRTVALWRLEVTGPVEVDQRRRHVRVNTKLRVQISQVDPSESGADGVTLDVSEAAFRCSFPSGRIDLEVDSPLALSFDLDGSQCEATGWVHTVRRNQGRTDVVVLFDQPVPCAQDLRKFVLQTQIQQRQKGRP